MLTWLLATPPPGGITANCGPRSSYRVTSRHKQHPAFGSSLSRAPAPASRPFAHPSRRSVGLGWSWRIITRPDTTPLAQSPRPRPSLRLDRSRLALSGPTSPRASSTLALYLSQVKRLLFTATAGPAWPEEAATHPRNPSLPSLGRRKVLLLLLLHQQPEPDYCLPTCLPILSCPTDVHLSHRMQRNPPLPAARTTNPSPHNPHPTRTARHPL